MQHLIKQAIHLKYMYRILQYLIINLQLGVVFLVEYFQLVSLPQIFQMNKLITEPQLSKMRIHSLEFRGFDSLLCTTLMRYFTN